MGIRLVVVDDNPHVSWEGRVHPVNATFQHFVAGLLDLPGSPVASVVSCVPVRTLAAEAGDAAPGRPVDVQPRQGAAHHRRDEDRIHQPILAQRRAVLPEQGVRADPE